MLERLKTRPEFLRVARARRKWVAPGLILQVALRDKDDFQPAASHVGEEEVCRIGFTASRKVGGAVVRNRAKRRLREVTEQMMPDHAKGGRDYVLIARSTTAARPFKGLVDDLETALKRMDSYRDASHPDAPDADAGGR